MNDITIYTSTIEELAQRIVKQDDSGLLEEYTPLDIQRAVRRSLDRAVDRMIKNFPEYIWDNAKLTISFDVQRTCDWPTCELPAQSDESGGHHMFCARHQAEEAARQPTQPEVQP